jgi:hypothetical protein
MSNILKASNKQVIVLSVSGSLKSIILRVTNMIIPIPNPINLLGHNCPSPHATKLSTDLT